MSVDHDPSLQLPGGPDGMGGGAQLPSITQDEYKRFSNRNSHPLTEREVEQGFHHFDRQKGNEGCVAMITSNLNFSYMKNCG